MTITTTAEYNRKYNLQRKALIELSDKRLKQIQHLLSENHQLKIELDMARELIDLKLKPGDNSAFTIKK